MSLLAAIDRYERLREHVEGWVGYLFSEYPELADIESEVSVRALIAECDAEAQDRATDAALNAELKASLSAKLGG